MSRVVYDDGLAELIRWNDACDPFHMNKSCDCKFMAL